MDQTFNIEANYDDLLKSISDVIMTLDGLKVQSKDIEKAFQDGNISAEQYNKSMAAVRIEVERNQQAQKLLEQEITNGIKAEQGHREAIEGVRSKLAESVIAYGKLSDAQKKSAQGKELEASIASQTDKLNELEAANAEYLTRMGDLQGASQAYAQSMMRMKVAGEGNSQAYKDMYYALEDVKNTMAEGQNSGNLFSGLASGLQTASDALGVYRSVMGDSVREDDLSATAIRNIETALTVLTTASTIYTTIQKQRSITDAAQNILMALGINQTERAAAAEMHLATAKGTGSIATKAIAAMQWLWNAALSANPILLVITGIVALTAGVAALSGAFSSSAAKQREANKANEEYEKQSKLTDAAVQAISINEKSRSEATRNRYQQELLEMRKNGASKQEIAAKEQQMQNELTGITVKASQDRVAELSTERMSAEANLTKQNDLLKTLQQTKGEDSKKYQEQLKVVQELTAARNELIGTIESEINAGKAAQIANDTRAQEGKEEAAKAAASRAKDMRQKEREAIRQSEDAALEVVKEGIEKQRLAVEQSYTRKIEDIQRRLKEEDNLTAAARQAMNDTILSLEQKKKQDLDKLSSEELDNRIARETERINLQLQVIQKGSDEELILRQELLARQRIEALRANAALTEDLRQQEADINAVYDLKAEELKNEHKAYNDEQAQIEKDKKESEAAEKWEQTKTAFTLEWQEKLMAIEQGSIAELELKAQMAQLEYEQLMAMDETTKASQFASEDAYPIACNEALQASKDKEIEIEQKVADTKKAIFDVTTGAFGEMLETFAGDSEAYAIFSKGMALFNIGVDTAKAIAAIPAMSTMGDPWTYALRVATAVATVMSSVSRAYKLLAKENAPKAPKFAVGGSVQGSGSSTSDSIMANLSNGESVNTAMATSMFAPLYSTLNQLGGGVPITTAGVSNQVLGEDMLARAVARGVASLPNPVVSVQQIDSVTARVRLYESMRIQ